MTMLTLDRVSLATPDGRLLFSDLTLSLGSERVGLVGRNGSGKSSLLHAIAGDMPPADGNDQRERQDCAAAPASPNNATPVPTALGTGEDWARLDRIEQGIAQDNDYERADWTLAARIEALLAELDLDPQAKAQRRARQQKRRPHTGTAFPVSHHRRSGGK